MDVFHTNPFRSAVKKLLTADELAAFENFISVRPDHGQVMPGLGGLRKVRWARAGKGKRGRVRVIYFYAIIRNAVYLIDIYAKAKAADLCPENKRRLLRFVEELKRTLKEEE